MKILVTGGAGYIGSLMTKRSLDKGMEIVVVDNLERGNRNFIDERAIFIEGDLREKDFVFGIFSEHAFDAVVNFAGYISVAESVANPYIYFGNNINISLNLIEAMVKMGQNNFIFSSTAAVYGNPVDVPIKEDHLKKPTNPYGESKLMVEKILSWYFSTYGLNSASLRYFNASGAISDASIGESHVPESHIIPNAMKAIIENKAFSLYGNDYNTRDGTCIRDYIHIEDLVEAHILMIDKLHKEKGCFTYNVGTGKGYSNKEVLEAIRKICGSFEVKFEKRRPGDPDTLIADPTKIKTELGFFPKYSDLDTIISTAWEWHKKNSKLKIKNPK